MDYSCKRILDAYDCLKSQHEDKDGCRLMMAILALVYAFLMSTKCLLTQSRPSKDLLP